MINFNIVYQKCVDSLIDIYIVLLAKNIDCKLLNFIWLINVLRFFQPFQNAKFDKITEIITELDESQQKGLLKLRIVDAKEVCIYFCK